MYWLFVMERIKNKLKNYKWIDWVLLLLATIIAIVSFIDIIRYLCIFNPIAFLTILAINSLFLIISIGSIIIKNYLLNFFVGAIGLICGLLMINPQTTSYNVTFVISGVIGAIIFVLELINLIVFKNKLKKSIIYLLIPSLLIGACYLTSSVALNISALNSSEIKNSIYSVPGILDVKRVDEEGTIEEISYETKNYYENRSEAISKKANVYLPYNYDASKRYNILYLMHGTGDNEQSWLKENVNNKYMLDNLIFNGYIDPLIVVTPTFYLNEENNKNLENLTYNFKDEFRNDLMPLVESRYSTYAKDYSENIYEASRSHRAFAGLSRGAVTTLRSIICGNMDVVSSFGTFSGSRTDSKYYKEHSLSESNKSYKIDLWYLSSGAFDFALESQLHDYKDILSIDDRLKVNENTAFDVYPNRYHSWENWHLSLFNFLLKVFK